MYELQVIIHFLKDSNSKTKQNMNNNKEKFISRVKKIM
jgi:hypothetical protein